MSIDKNYNQSQYSGELLESDRSFLEKIYKERNRKLFELLKEEVIW